MGKKLVTGLAVSVGAGIALAVTGRAAQKGKTMSKSAGTMTPVTIRVHTAMPRGERSHSEAAFSQDLAALAATTETPASVQQKLELAELKLMIESLDQRSNEMLNTVNQRIDDLQSHLPRFIDVKVTARIREVEERLREEFQDEQSKVVDAFLATLDRKVLPRISMVEEALSAQGVEIGEMRQRIEKTDETLDRILDRIERAVNTTVSPFAAHANGHVTEISKAVA